MAPTLWPFLFSAHSVPCDSIPLLCLQDAFFYSLVYDPQQKTLLADKGEIRVGNKYQADITDLLKEGEAYVKHPLAYLLFLCAHWLKDCGPLWTFSHSKYFIDLSVYSSLRPYSAPDFALRVAVVGWAHLSWHPEHVAILITGTNNPPLPSHSLVLFQGEIYRKHS